MNKSPAQCQDVGPCLNCEAPLTGNYCANCGQERKELRRPFFRLSSEAIESLFELDGRAFRTLYYLLTKPAHLTLEYFAGRRSSYTAPLRLFIVISVSFFLIVSFYTSIRSMEEVLTANGGVDSADETTALSIESGADEDEGEEDSGLADLLAFVEAIDLPFFAAQTNENLRRAMRAQAEANLNTAVENPNEFLRGYLEYITIFILVMIPFLALIQKLIYIRSGHYYVEHLVLTLHNHAFMIFVFFILSLTGLVEESQIPIINSLFGYLGTAISIWIVFYLFLSLKNYFQQGYGITLLKYLTTSMLYAITLGFGVLLFAGILFFLL